MSEKQIVRWTSDRTKRLEHLRERLRASKRDVEIVNGIPTNDAVLDEAFSALEKELDIQEEDAKWDESFARSQDFLQQLADEARAADEAGLTEEFDPSTDPDFQ